MSIKEEKEKETELLCYRDSFLPGCLFVCLCVCVCFLFVLAVVEEQVILVGRFVFASGASSPSSSFSDSIRQFASLLKLVEQVVLIRRTVIVASLRWVSQSVSQSGKEARKRNKRSFDSFSRALRTLK